MDVQVRMDENNEDFYIQLLQEIHEYNIHHLDLDNLVESNQRYLSKKYN
jgi:hypothetical protein